MEIAIPNLTTIPADAIQKQNIIAATGSIIAAIQTVLRGPLVRKGR